jgi:2-C-methyl-D-erythritol 2,4-cyclodiphosphate synthase
MDFRVGMGYDVHALAEGRPLILGGVEIDFEKGCQGHSDADVLIHAICDALLGAANLGDIGKHFPDSDPLFKGIDSTRLLTRVIRMLQEEKWEIGNVDATLAIQQPKIAPHIRKMQNVLAEKMMCEASQISIKATTTEKMGFEGRGEGVSAYAVVLINKKD